MNLQRVFISGRLIGDPEPHSNHATGEGELFTVSVDDDGTSRLWSVFLVATDKLSRRLADGDIVAVIGLMNEDRQKLDVRGPVMAEALLALKHGGEYFLGLSGLG